MRQVGELKMMNRRSVLSGLVGGTALVGVVKTTQATALPFHALKAGTMTPNEVSKNFDPDIRWDLVMAMYHGTRYAIESGFQKSREKYKFSSYNPWDKQTFKGIFTDQSLYRRNKSGFYWWWDINFDVNYCLICERKTPFPKYVLSINPTNGKYEHIHEIGSGWEMSPSLTLREQVEVLKMFPEGKDVFPKADFDRLKAKAYQS